MLYYSNHLLKTQTQAILTIIKEKRAIYYLQKQILLFNSKGGVQHYSLQGHKLNIIEEAKYLGVIFQSDMKLTTHIHRNYSGVPINAKRLAYKSLCLPHLEYMQQLLGSQTAGKTYQT